MRSNSRMDQDNSITVDTRPLSKFVGVVSIVLFLAAIPLCIFAYFSVGTLQESDPGAANTILWLAVIVPFVSQCFGIYAICVRSPLRWLAGICAVLTGMFFILLLFSYFVAVPP